MLTSNLEGNRARSRCKDLSRLRTGETLITYYETSCEEAVSYTHLTLPTKRIV